MVDVGKAILESTKVIPDGMVVFFPSYAYLDQCVRSWKEHHLPNPSGATVGQKTLWDTLKAKKQVFQESKSNTNPPGDGKHDSTARPSSVDETLSAYAAAVASGCGGLLLAVIGGSLSEGINFSDALGRGVVVIGLPFPNPHSPEWKAKMDYISQKASATASGIGKTAAREFYENACMRAVNQCIGRAIRHREDYAAIMLLDRRYGHERIRSKLPGWIKKSLGGNHDVAAAVQGIRAFFARR